MLDLETILSNRAAVEQGLSMRMDRREAHESLNQVVELATKRRQLISKIEDQRRLHKLDSQAFAQARREGRDSPPAVAIGKEQRAFLERELANIAQQLETCMLELPNLPARDVVAGGKEANRVIDVWGEMPTNAPHDHVTISERLDLVDYQRGIKLGGSGFWMYTGMGARLEWALIDWFIEQHLKSGYTFILPPHLLLDSAGIAAGQFPKFVDDVYHIATEQSQRGQFLLPTAETALIGAFQDEIINISDLPKKLFAYTPCYRLERAGSHSDERGTVRGHQFNKVEIFEFVCPQDGESRLEHMVEHVEGLVRLLGLHYQRTLLAAGDASASMRKTIDVEVWMPSSGKYKEVASVSWAGDYQARRANVRTKEPGANTTTFVHTLNGSALATSRVFPAILEQYQDGDSVIVPEVLRSRVGVDRISPAS